MGGTIKRRLLTLERSVNTKRTSMMAQIQQAALQAISDEDLDHLSKVVGRGEPFSACTPEEQSALDRYCAEYEAAQRIASRSLP